MKSPSTTSLFDQSPPKNFSLPFLSLRSLRAMRRPLGAFAFAWTLLLLLPPPPSAATILVPPSVVIFTGVPVPAFTVAFHTDLPSAPGQPYSQPVCPRLASFSGATASVVAVGTDGVVVTCAFNLTIPAAVANDLAATALRVNLAPIVAHLGIDRVANAHLAPQSAPLVVAAMHAVAAVVTSPPLVLAAGHQTVRVAVYGAGAAGANATWCANAGEGFSSSGFGDVHGTATFAFAAGGYSCSFNVTVEPSLFGEAAKFPEGLTFPVNAIAGAVPVDVAVAVADSGPPHGPPPAATMGVETGRVVCSVVGCTLRVALRRTAVRTAVGERAATPNATTASLVAPGAGVVTPIAASAVRVLREKVVLEATLAPPPFYATVETTVEFAFDLAAHRARLNDTNASQATVTVRGEAFDYTASPARWVPNSTLVTFALYFASPFTPGDANATIARVPGSPTAVQVSSPLVIGLAYEHDTDGVMTVVSPGYPSPALFPRVFAGGAEVPVRWGTGRLFAQNGVFTGRAEIAANVTGAAGANVTVVSPFFDGDAAWLPSGRTWSVFLPPYVPPFAASCDAGQLAFWGTRPLGCTFAFSGVGTTPTGEFTLGPFAVTSACDPHAGGAVRCVLDISGAAPVHATGYTLFVTTADGVRRPGPFLTMAPPWFLTNFGLSVTGTVLRGPVGYVQGAAPTFASPPPPVTVTLAFSPSGVVRQVSLAAASVAWLAEGEWYSIVTFLAGDMVEVPGTTNTVTVTMPTPPMWLNGSWVVVPQPLAPPTLRVKPATATFPIVPVPPQPPQSVVVVANGGDQRTAHSVWWTVAATSLFHGWVLLRLLRLMFAGAPTAPHKYEPLGQTDSLNDTQPTEWRLPASESKRATQHQLW